MYKFLPFLFVISVQAAFGGLGETSKQLEVHENKRRYNVGT